MHASDQLLQEAQRTLSRPPRRLQRLAGAPPLHACLLRLPVCPPLLYDCDGHSPCPPNQPICGHRGTWNLAPQSLGTAQPGPAAHIGAAPRAGSKICRTALAQLARVVHESGSFQVGPRSRATLPARLPLPLSWKIRVCTCMHGLPATVRVVATHQLGGGLKWWQDTAGATAARTSIPEFVCAAIRDHVGQVLADWLLTVLVPDAVQLR